uniref:G_PROTEIN_RECEP_F1_2 domain-containing protein n=1 Tax=Onchocerca volvulus TaxID=6282 RepID=A0A8R1XXW3_ONCVO
MELYENNSLTMLKSNDSVAYCLDGIFTNYQVDYRLYGNLPISIFGILINLINIIIFSHADMRKSLVNRFLLTISITDLLLLIFNFFFLLFPVIAIFSNFFILQHIYPVVLRYSYPLARIAQTCGVYLTLFLSVHRYLGVCHPFQAKRWITGKPVKYAIFGSIVFSFVINSTTWLELTVVPCFSKEFNQLSRHIQLTELQMDYTYGIVMKVITYTLVMFIFPFFILIIVNTRIILALKHSSNMRALHASGKSLLSKINHSQKNNQNEMAVILNPSYATTALHFSSTNFTNFRTMLPRVSKPTTNYHSSTRDSSVTLMLLAIVAMFLTCNGLAFCNNIIEILIFVDKIDNSENQSAFEKSVEIANILVSLNSSTSIFIYLIFSSKYRLIVKEYLGLKKIHKAYGGTLAATGIAVRHTFEYPFFREEISQTPARLRIFSGLRVPSSVHRNS